MKWLAILSIVITLTDATNGVPLEVRTVDANQAPLPARLHLTNHGGKIMEPSDNTVFWRDHASSDGKATYELPSGTYRLEVARGPEWIPVTKALDLTDTAEPHTITITLYRLTDLTQEGWWSGETHIHRPIDEIATLMAAEDLHVGHAISWWNQTNPWLKSPPDPVVSFEDGRRYYHLLGGEDERDGGALLYLNLKRSLAIAEGTQHFPSSLHYAKEARTTGAWIDIEKPFWWDVPMWIAHGIGDSIGIANNHMQRLGMLDNEAWGKPRNFNHFPGPHGNGLWTQEIYYHLLNAGIRIPPSAGAASGVLPNPVGYNRAYVHLDGSLTMDKWFQGLHAGKVFVTNGPLLRVTADGHPPGHIFHSDRSSILLTLHAQVDSHDPIDRLELVHNGVVKPFPFPQQFPIHESGWFLVRAITEREETFRFASTGPFYVELGPQPQLPHQRASARFFIDWCEDRLETLRAEPALTDSQREQVRQPWETALAFWKAKELEAPERLAFRASIVDADSGAPLPARVYLHEQDGSWHFVRTASPSGTAVPYEKRNWIRADAEEMHTTVSAHPIVVSLHPGTYTITIERGKEYLPLTETFTLTDSPIDLTLSLQRWVNMRARGWYSGDTHVHRTLEELPNVMLAEDLNVAFPLTYWVTEAFTPPTHGDKTSAEDAIPDTLIKIDDTHVIWPRNTEWEIFSIGGHRHTLGAVFALGHRTAFQEGVPPVSQIAEKARRENALLDLDKHDWPWSMTLPPTMGVQLYELSNNHLWRTEFAFREWNSPTPPYLRPPLNAQSGGEREWILFTMANYYALLNAGQAMQPTAGTASGVHPVPLGFGRVYVHLPDGFSYERWKEGLQAGRSFVTTGPMMFATMNGASPGKVFTGEAETLSAEVTGEILSEQALEAIEIIHNGHPIATIHPENRPRAQGGYHSSLTFTHTFTESGWLALRCWEVRGGTRVRFAHTAPWHVRIPDKPLYISKEERAYLIDRVKREINRSQPLMPPAALQEYRRALRYYQELETRPPLPEE